MWTSEAFEVAARHHDAQMAAAGLTVWVKSEPTFTDRAAQSPQWLSQALSGDKEQRAQALLMGIGRRLPGSLVRRSRGRLYPGEDQPRWCLGLYRHRNGTALWQGPPDPILATPGVETLPDLDPWAAALAAELRKRGFAVATERADSASTARTSMRDDAVVADAAESGPPRIALQFRAALSGGQPDDPAPSGAHVLALGMPETGGRPTACIEMPICRH